MTKRLTFILLMMALLGCVFALSVSAVGSDSNDFAEAPSTIEGVKEPSVIGTSERVVLLGADGKYYTYPAYYIVNDNTSFSITVNNALNSELGYNDGTNLKSYVVRIEIPYGITYIGTDLNYKSNLVYVKMSDTVKTVEAKVFQECKNLETLILSNNLTNISNDFCKDCNSLTSIVIPSSVKEIKGYSFHGCSKLSTVINYAENVKSIDGNAFSGCPIENEFNFPDALTSIGAYAFNGAKFTSVDIPNAVSSMGSGVFQNCSNLKFVRFPESLTQLPHDSMKFTSNVTVVIPRACTSIYSVYSLQGTGINKIIFTGTQDSDFVKSVTEKASSYVSKIEYANHCEYYYDGNHTPDLKYVFTSFVDECYTESLCSRCQLTKTEITYNPIFQFNGYSTNGKKICVGYSIDNTSLAKYKENYPDAVFSFGIIASANNNTPINENGEFAEKSINIDLTNKNYASVDFILSGDWNNSDSAAAKISMNLYVIEATKDKPSVSYIYGELENERLVTKSYSVADGVSYNELNLIKGE